MTYTGDSCKSGLPSLRKNYLVEEHCLAPNSTGFRSQINLKFKPDPVSFRSSDFQSVIPWCQAFVYAACSMVPRQHLKPPCRPAADPAAPRWPQTRPAAALQWPRPPAALDTTTN